MGLCYVLCDGLSELAYGVMRDQNYMTFVSEYPERQLVIHFDSLN